MAFVTRSACQTEANQTLRQALSSVREEDGLHLAATASAGSFGYAVGGAGVGGALLVGEAANNNTKTSIGRLEIALPQNYEAGSALSVVVRARANLVLNTAATVDIEAYRLDGEGGVSSDLNGTAAQNVNSTSWANLTFAVDGSTLSPGDVLELYLTAIANDAGGTTNGRIEIGGVHLVTTTRM